MKVPAKTAALALLGMFAAGGACGWLGARMVHAPAGQAAPAQWVARIGDQYISVDAFVDEMKRRGGDRPGQFQDMEQKRRLLDDLVYRAALVAAAERTGLTVQPDVRLAVDQVISNRYVQSTLRDAQREVSVTDDEVAKYYAEHATDYTVPARKRAAMLKISVAANAGDAAWVDATQRMQAARTKAAGLDARVPHFGPLAIEVSDDDATRYRGGVIGWIAEGSSARYSHDRAVLDAVRELENPGDLSPVLRGADGVYLVRLVESEPRQSRTLEQLAAGIRQRLMQDRLQAAETQFRQQLMRQVGVEVRESALAAIAPVGPPANTTPPQPPAMPQDQG